MGRNMYGIFPEDLAKLAAEQAVQVVPVPEVVAEVVVAPVVEVAAPVVEVAVETPVVAPVVEVSAPEVVEVVAKKSKK